MQDNTSNKINSLKKSIKDFEKEIKEIQEECKHNEFIIDLVEGSLLKKCKECELFLGYLSNQEKKQSGYI